jgi:hypothetical protein
MKSIIKKGSVNRIGQIEKLANKLKYVSPDLKQLGREYKITPENFKAMLKLHTKAGRVIDRKLK